MRKTLILLTALASTAALAGCGSKTDDANATLTEASADDSVNLATDVAPTVAATEVAPSEAAGATVPATASPTADASGAMAETPAAM